MGNKKPSILDMMKTFTKDVIDYAKEGAPHVTEGQYKNRLGTCEQCPHLRKDTMRCGLCGCVVEHKAKWGTTTCPDNRWTPVKVSTSTHSPKLKRNDSRTSTKTGK